MKNFDFGAKSELCPKKIIPGFITSLNLQRPKSGFQIIEYSLNKGMANPGHYRSCKTMANGPQIQSRIIFGIL